MKATLFTTMSQPVFLIKKYLQMASLSRVKMGYIWPIQIKKLLKDTLPATIIVFTAESTIRYEAGLLTVLVPFIPNSWNHVYWKLAF
jgi:hypothetical protein